MNRCASLLLFLSITAVSHLAFAQCPATVPAANMVGEPGDGWALAMTVVGHEREPSTLGYAARYGKRALCICTISDHILTGEDTTSEQRQNSFTTMMKVALDTAVAMENK